MFSDIGAKLKALAKVIFVILLIIVFIAATAILIGSRGDSLLLAFLVALIGGVVAWLSVLVLYAFGELVDNSKKIRESLEPKPSTSQANRFFKHEKGNPIDPSKSYITKKDGAVRPVKNKAGQQFVCPFCGAYVDSDICYSCGAKFWEEDEN